MTCLIYMVRDGNWKPFRELLKSFTFLQLCAICLRDNFQNTRFSVEVTLGFLRKSLQKGWVVSLVNLMLLKSFLSKFFLFQNFATSGRFRHHFRKIISIQKWLFWNDDEILHLLQKFETEEKVWQIFLNQFWNSPRKQSDLSVEIYAEIYVEIYFTISSIF